MAWARGPRIRGEDGHREHPGVGADVEERLGVGAESDHEVKSKGVFGFGASAAPPVELLGDLAAKGLDEDEVGSTGTSAHLGEFDRSGQTADLHTSEPRRDRAQQGVEHRLGERLLHGQFEPEPRLSARGERPQVVFHDDGPLADRTTFAHTINRRTTAPEPGIRWRRRPTRRVAL